MNFTVKWVEQDPEKEFWDVFPEDKTLPKELLIRHFHKPDTDTKPRTVSVYYALLCTETEPAAGVVFLYFPQTSALLIRHVFIKDAYRKHFDLDGIDPKYKELTHLFSNKRTYSSEQDGLAHLLSTIRSRTGQANKVIYVFGETINVLKATELSLDEHKRLNKLHRFYASIKGKTFKTDQYDRPRVGNEFANQKLSLINFPEFHGHQPFTVSIPIILSFVEEYQQFISTGGENSEQITNWSAPELSDKISRLPLKATAADLQLAGLVLKNEHLEQLLLGLIGEKYVENKPFVYMRELPRLEEPKIFFNRACVCFELMVDEDYYEPKHIDPEQKFFKITDEDEEKAGWEKVTALVESIFSQKKDPELTREQKIEKILEDGYCIVHHSFETDLLAYKYQSIPPFFTKNYRPSQLTTIQFPESSDFISEGRIENFYTWPLGEKREIKMNCFLNYSYFLNSRMRVWHIVFRPSDEHPVSEFDIIKLMKFFSGSQESTSEVNKKKLLEEVKFGVADQGPETYSFLDFFEKLSGIDYKKQSDYTDNTDIDEKLSLQKNIKTGIVQLDSMYTDLAPLVGHLKNSILNTYDPEDPESVDKLTQEALIEDLKDYHLSLSDESDSVAGANAESRFANIAYLLKTYCAITLGLFDFERMGSQEITDTLKPRPASLDDAYFLMVNRGVITSYSINDNVLNSTWNTLGINPYLVIPSAVLVHNEYVSGDADNRLTKVLERGRDKRAKSIKLGELIGERNFIDDLVNDDILSNVFQYPSEQDLYDYGMKHRGINERINDTKSKLAQLDKIIEQLQSKKSIDNERLIQIVLAFLSLFQIASFFADYSGITANEQVATWSMIGGLGMLLFYLIVFRNSKVRISKPKKNAKQNKRS